MPPSFAYKYKQYIGVSGFQSHIHGRYQLKFLSGKDWQTMIIFLQAKDSAFCLAKATPDFMHIVFS